jgi:YD repeat-containing protein
MKRQTMMSLAAAILLILPGCSDGDEKTISEGREMTFTVEPKLTILFQDTETAQVEYRIAMTDELTEGQYLFELNEIEGFEYEEGFEYRISVLRFPSANPAAGTYRLKEILSKETATPEVPDEAEEPDSRVTMKVYCQADPDSYYSIVEYGYKDSKPIYEKTYLYDVLNRVKTLAYNSGGQLTKEVTYNDRRTIENDYIYNGDGQQIKINATVIDYYPDRPHIDSQTSSTATFEYEGNLLVKATATWGGYHIYEYDGQDRMITNTAYTKLDQKHSIVRYKYADNLKTEETEEIGSTGEILYLRRFEYDDNGRLLRIIENDQVVEENTYDGNRLTEKWTYYFGIDPGASFCLGNYIYRYEY